MRDNFVVILLGPPGSGKGTQAALVAEKFGLVHLETSDIIEKKFKEAPKNQEIQEAKKLFLAGKLTPPPLIVSWISEEIKKLHGAKKGIVFDGSPRTLFEAERLYPFIREKYGGKNIQVIYIEVRPQESIWRNTRRKICQKCDKPIPHTEETKNLKTCPNLKCKGKLITRQLDNPNIIEERLKVFKKETYPVVKFFEEKGLLKRVRGEQSIEDVFKDITKALNLK